MTVDAAEDREVVEGRSDDEDTRSCEPAGLSTEERLKKEKQSSLQDLRTLDFRVGKCKKLWE